MVDAFLEGTAGALDSPGDIVLDLTRLTFIDSSGLKAVAELAQRVNGIVVLRCPPPLRISTSWASTASWAFASWADVDTRCCQGGSGNRQRHARRRHPDHRRWSGRAAGPPACGLLRTASRPRRGQPPDVRGCIRRDRVNLGLGYEQALRIHAELPGDARPADDPGHRYPVRGPGRRGAATSPSERREG